MVLVDKSGKVTFAERALQLKSLVECEGEKEVVKDKGGNVWLEVKYEFQLPS